MNRVQYSCKFLSLLLDQSRVSVRKYILPYYPAYERKKNRNLSRGNRRKRMGRGETLSIRVCPENGKHALVFVSS